MMTYKMRKFNDGYRVIEKDTNHVISKKLTQNKAREIQRALNLSKGFQGWTPLFMVREHNK